MSIPFDKNWQIQPIDSESGLTYQGETEKGKVFIKRNSSPFLTVLSQEGIAPKLLWTKRISNGDVVTAQEWIEGRVLTPEEMITEHDVVEILHRVHVSPLLNKMLKKIEFTMITPEKLFGNLNEHLISEFSNLDEQSKKIVHYLLMNYPNFPIDNYTVCHGEPLEKNWLLAESGRLFLVDWDTVVFADPAYDLSLILSSYLPYNQWDRWLESYDILSGEKLFERIKWYALFHLLTNNAPLNKTQQVIISNIIEL